MWVGKIRLLHIRRSSSHAPTSNFFTHIAAKQFPHPPSWMYTAVHGNWLNILLYSAVSSRHGSSQEFPSLVHSICTSSAPALEMHSAQVLEMLAQRECPRSVQVLQKNAKSVSKSVLHNSYVITVSKQSKLGTIQIRAKFYACARYRVRLRFRLF